MCWLVILSAAQKGMGHHTQQQSWAVRNFLHEIHQLMNSFTNPLELLSQFSLFSSVFFVSSFGFLCDWKLIQFWPKRKQEGKNTIVFNVWPKVTTCDWKEKAKKKRSIYLFCLFEYLLEFGCSSFPDFSLVEPASIMAEFSSYSHSCGRIVW